MGNQPQAGLSNNLEDCCSLKLADDTVNLLLSRGMVIDDQITDSSPSINLFPPVEMNTKRKNFAFDFPTDVFNFKELKKNTNRISERYRSINHTNVFGRACNTNQLSYPQQGNFIFKGYSIEQPIKPMESEFRVSKNGKNVYRIRDLKSSSLNGAALSKDLGKGAPARKLPNKKGDCFDSITKVFNIDQNKFGKINCQSCKPAKSINNNTSEAEEINSSLRNQESSKVERGKYKDVTHKQGDIPPIKEGDSKAKSEDIKSNDRTGTNFSEKLSFVAVHPPQG